MIVRAIGIVWTLIVYVVLTIVLSKIIDLVWTYTPIVIEKLIKVTFYVIGLLVNVLKGVINR